MIKRLHHLNFIVHELEASAPRFSTLFGVEPGPVEEFHARGVRLCRFKVGETWIVLVQPTDPAGVPARYLETNGEGFFLASFEVQNLEQSLDRLARAGIKAGSAGPRAGLDDWKVIDLDADCFAGIGVQLVEAGSVTEAICPDQGVENE